MWSSSNTTGQPPGPYHNVERTTKWFTNTTNHKNYNHYCSFLKQLVLYRHIMVALTLKESLAISSFTSFPPAPPGPPYKGDTGRWITKALFLEEWRHIAVEDRVTGPLFTYSVPHPLLIDGKAAFVELGDPTGYKWAMQYLGSYDHWLALMSASWFKSVFNDWSNELRTKQVADSVAKIVELSKGDGASALAAAKYLAEKGWEPKHGRGRPNKSELDKELKRQAELTKQQTEDLERIGGLTAIKGGKT